MWTIDLCRIWVAPPAHSLVARRYVYWARVIKIVGNSVGVWVWDYGKPKRENKKVCINGYICIHAFYWFWYFLILMKCLCLICCIALWIFMFVLAELWLITYIRDVGTKGKQVSDACWDVCDLPGRLWMVCAWRVTVMVIIFHLIVYGLCYLKFRIYFWKCNLDILLSVCKHFKSSELDNSLVNFHFDNTDFLQGIVLR